METRDEFVKEHEMLKKNLGVILPYKVLMLIIVAIILILFAAIIKGVITYQHGDSLSVFGTRYFFIFLFLGLYFAFLKMVENEEKEYHEKWKALFRKHFNV